MVKYTEMTLKLMGVRTVAEDYANKKQDIADWLDILSTGLNEDAKRYQKDVDNLINMRYKRKFSMPDAIERYTKWQDKIESLGVALLDDAYVEYVDESDNINDKLADLMGGFDALINALESSNPYTIYGTMFFNSIFLSIEKVKESLGV